MPDTCKPELVAEQLERILSVPPLAASPSLCRFLRYVVQETLAGRSGSLKEYSLGVVAFERGDEFDPRMDPIVRVQARNLRVRLSQYYSGPGAQDPIVIELPKRTYVPVFRHRVEQPIAVEAVGEPAPPAPSPPQEVSAPAGETAVEHAQEAAAPAASQASGPRWLRPVVFTVGLLIAIAGSAGIWRARTHEAYAKSLREPNPAAQDLYIRGRILLDQQREGAMRQSIECFRQAIDRDPQFASAYAGLADAYNILAQFGYLAPGEGMEQARTAALRALKIDPLLAEAHVSLASVLEAYDWNWTGAEREYRRALELNPGLAEGHLWYGMFLRDQGRIAEALPQLRRAAQLEPYSILTSLNLAAAFLQSGDSEAAVNQARHAADMAPDLICAQVILASAYSSRSQLAEADAALARGLLSSQDDPHGLSLLAKIYARRGDKQKSLMLMRQIEQLATRRYVSPFDIGSVALVLGDEKRAVGLLEEAFRQHSAGLIFLRAGKSKGWDAPPEVDTLIEKMRFAG